MRKLCLAFAVGLSTIVWAEPPTYTKLVSKEEAARPDAKPRITRGLFPGPAIRLDGAASRPLISPFPLRFEFVPRNQATVDVSSVKLLYLKSPSIDLTPRIAGSISKGGINLAHVALPPGNHYLQVSVVDSNGNRGAATFTLTVKK